MISLTAEQQIVHDAMFEFALNGSGHMTVGGYAGTGKTTLLAEMIRSLMAAGAPPVIAFCCYTGKAASVLRSKLKAAIELTDEIYVGTIHGLMYKPEVQNEIIVGWKRVEVIPAQLIVVDEASMVNEEIWNDLLSYGIPIIAVGDHGQLPPIEGAFNLMENPKHKLEHIHRQAENNPIIRLSMLARTEGEIPYGKYGLNIIKISGKNDAILDRISDLKQTLFLCGLNRTRMSVNKAVRARLGIKSLQPIVGDKVICLRNNRAKGIFNGMGGSIISIQPNGRLWYDAQILMDDGRMYEGNVLQEQFGAERTIQIHPLIPQKDLKDLFDFGYCLTVHKAQGSEAESVVLFEERFKASDDNQWRRWLYTAVTRARTSLMIVNRRFSFN